MNLSIHEICEDLIEDSVYLWEQEGALLPTIFALGYSRSLFAQPMNQKGFTIDNATKVRLHALMAANVGSVYIGRIDETFYAERLVTEAPLNPKELEQLAKHDPTIRTAIMVQAMDMKAEKAVIHLAVASVNDDGETNWELIDYEQPVGLSVDEGRAVVAFTQLLTQPITDAELVDELYEHGWSLADSDNLAKYQGDEEW